MKRVQICHDIRTVSYLYSRKPAFNYSYLCQRPVCYLACDQFVDNLPIEFIEFPLICYIVTKFRLDKKSFIRCFGL